MSLNSAVGYFDSSKDVRVVRCPMGHEYAVSASAYYSGAQPCPYCAYSMAPEAGYANQVHHTSASASYAAHLRTMKKGLAPLRDTPGDWLDNEINKVRRLAFAA